MVAVKRITSHQLHRNSNIKEGEGIRDVLRGVKNFANKMHNKITRKEGAKSLKEVANIAKQREQDYMKQYENTAIARRHPEKLKQLLDQKEKIADKIRKQNSSYMDTAKYGHTSTPVIKEIIKGKHERLNQKDKPNVINSLNIDPRTKNVLNQNLGFKKEMVKDVNYSLGKSSAPGFFDRREKKLKDNLTNYY